MVESVARWALIQLDLGSIPVDPVRRSPLRLAGKRKTVRNPKQLNGSLRSQPWVNGYTVSKAYAASGLAMRSVRNRGHTLTNVVEADRHAVPWSEVAHGTGPPITTSSNQGAPWALQPRQANGNRGCWPNANTWLETGRIRTAST